MARAATIPITPFLPRALPPAARAKVHAAIESHIAAVEALTAFLDEADCDSDLEQGGDDEPSMGSLPCVGYCGDMGASPAYTWDQSLWSHGVTDDREFDLELNEAGEEDAQHGAA